MRVRTCKPARGVVATCSPLASEAGVRTLQNGGNAIDAAVAAAGVLSRLAPSVLQELDAKGLAELYRETRPLFRDAYRDLGYPDRDFDDTLAKAIQVLLATPDPGGELLIRRRVKEFLPSLAALPARLHGRPVSVAADRLPVAGPFAEVPSLWVVGGMVSPLVFAPSLAERVAASLADESAPELAGFGPDRLRR